ncbi:MAG TPA: hypothetical protein VFT19_11980 [Solirubrobacterales bacterium]|nr:hypothetical protein [Solirubrobacterales bacterium]
MARRSLKPQLNQIRAWVQQGRTDAWIAHQLEVSASELREFRKQHDLNPDAEQAGGGGEEDLRDEIEAEVEAATAEEAEAEAEEPEEEADEAEDDDDDGDEADDEKPARKPRARKKAGGGGEGEAGDSDRPRRRRRRGRRGGRGRRKEIEATFDHGERDGYGLWLDAAVKDNPVYSEHWAGKSAVTVRIDADQIVIRRAGESGGDGDSDD